MAKTNLAIFCEFSNSIGTGHLIESCNLAKLAQKMGFGVSLWVTDNTPAAILKKLSYAYNFFHSLECSAEVAKIHMKLAKASHNKILFNFRKINNRILSLFKSPDWKLICIDELGRRRLACDAVINTSIVKKCHSYKNGRLKIYAGPQYLTLAEDFSLMHARKKKISRTVKNISVCMGGLDKSRTTLKIIDALAEWKKNALKHIIIGGAASFLNEAKDKIKKLKGKNFRLYYNVGNIARIFAKSDIAFSAGGNVLYELACVGTPAIVLYESGHEKENALTFQRRGFGICLGQGVRQKKESIVSALRKLEDLQLRRRQSYTGKKIVDAKGSRRILDIVKNL